jgi:hypothetical protein
MYLRGCARSRGRLSRSTASRDQGKTFPLKILFQIFIISLDLVSGEGSSIVTGITSPTPSVAKLEFSFIELILLLL